MIASTLTGWSFDGKSVYKEKEEVNKLATWVWNEVQINSDDKIDWDKNGSVNCCDKAVSWCRRWKKYSDRPIRLCQQQTNKMDHMYVQVYMSWGWWSIDPCYTDILGNHDMKEVWNEKYSKWNDDPYGYWVEYFEKYIYKGSPKYFGF